MAKNISEIALFGFNQIDGTGQLITLQLQTITAIDIEKVYRRGLIIKGFGELIVNISDCSCSLFLHMYILYFLYKKNKPHVLGYRGFVSRSMPSSGPHCPVSQCKHNASLRNMTKIAQFAVTFWFPLCGLERCRWCRWPSRGAQQDPGQQYSRSRSSSPECSLTSGLCGQ